MSQTAPAPHTPRRGPSQQPPLLCSENALQPGNDPSAPLRAEVDSLKAQMKTILDMLQDHGQSLAMEAQERAELLRLLDTERKERARTVQELSAALEAEREARARDRQDLMHSIQSEVEARTQDVRQLAKSLQSECNARAGEVKQLAGVFRSEREDRVREVEELAEELRTEFASRAADDGGAAIHSGGAPPGAERLTSDVANTKIRCDKAGHDVELLQSETGTLTQRLQELTEFVLTERDARTREMQELRTSFRS